MPRVEPSDWLWKEGGAYYTAAPEDLLRRPVLPDPMRLRDRRLIDLFDRFGGISPGRRVMELGCGGSPWLPFLAVARGADVTGLELEPHAAELARANLLGAGARGTILCRDAFARWPDLEGRFDLVFSMGVMEHFDDVEVRLAAAGRYLRPGGRILTTVPNLQGINWTLQRLGDLRTLRAHVVHGRRSLRAAHEAAGFDTIAAGYSGFYDGFLTSSASSTPARRRVHAALCRLTSLAAAAWIRAGRGALAPEAPWWSAHVFCAGRAPDAAVRRPAASAAGSAVSSPARS
ncbi:MAG TPA: class I SAM-dependent methyltransferase [Candidatus Polarisedimenticolia bacterium]|nr:class I SAM-dependent methyltransferase [Candidatus Polarisedimenticolia bacterium]